uniref:Serine/arginine repetitive matrix 4 n=1 Tax=Buteo japonicus TaxID=224669 RepID=A0A8C0HPD8_9AVES
MASVQQGEKQLFEKFWRGTFKAVATPRPESVIVASITARKPLPSSRGRTRKSHRHRHRHCHSRSESSDSHSPSCRMSCNASQWAHRCDCNSLKTKNHHPQNRSNNAKWLFCFQISQSGSSADLFTKTDSPPGNLASQNGEYHEYDSGNDTSSPPSTQTSSSRSKDSQEKRSLVHDGFGHAFSSGKPKLANSDNSSDSGNSFTSCFSQTKGTALENLSPDAQGQDRRGCLSLCLSCSEEKQNFLPSPTHSSPLRPCSRSESYTSTGRSSPGSSRSSRSRSSHRKASPRYSRSRSCSSEKSEKESHRERDRQRRRRSYSPLRKRRRDSPSHLEARRITSARKRPIPYYRPSPSSSSSASSYSSWYSSFSRSPSRSRSYSSYRTSRSRSWSSSSAEGRSRSRSSGPRSSRSRSRSYDSGGSSDSLRR